MKSELLQGPNKLYIVNNCNVCFIWERCSCKERTSMLMLSVHVYCHSSGFVVPWPSVSPAALLPSRPDSLDQHQNRRTEDQRQWSLKQNCHSQNSKMIVLIQEQSFGFLLSANYTLFLFYCDMKVLEKMRPIDHKLKYQIDKLVRTAVTGSLGIVLLYFVACMAILLTAVQNNNFAGCSWEWSTSAPSQSWKSHQQSKNEFQSFPSVSRYI